MAELSQDFELSYEDVTARRSFVRNILISAECADTAREAVAYRLAVVQEKINRNLGGRTVGD